ncbi:bifunctional diaminohydroxyphosphoribosylaminopyrimidine deaminase/5-amino-6-(5-phosphoribosylamino)uracil reductase RibD [Caldimonas sp. KR1-144]|uniref:bifunctional diaminohydroxyphosphoribosylaminopyrimidine deaminase/5-amino-6-(5-phosphoribosylamino)uracil reductase RibD n=1 Tax=Caldimonas sp. KR1-144 TaxID=3400911 RepID=UPI003C0BF6CE
MHIVLPRAHWLAEGSIGVSEPNPRVGCVLTGSDGRTLGEGRTDAAGGPHAEVVALRTAGHDLHGATAYVTLEPCSHHGRTPPCCDALIAAGIARVVVAIEDPNPLVAGQGIARLRAAGIEVEVVDGEWGRASRELNIGFFSRMIRKRPWVRMKIAASLDGRTALENGTSQWITGEAARIDGHAWRKRAGAILTGIGTVLEDDPRLDVRLVDTEVQPWRVVIDSRLELAPVARIVQPPGRVLVYCSLDLTQAEAAARAKALSDAGVTVRSLPGALGKVDLAAVLDDLAANFEINELHVEAGHKLNGSLMRECLVDEFLVYLAPTMIGLGREMARFGPLEQLSQALALRYESVERVGDDLRIVARPPGRADF